MVQGRATAVRIDQNRAMNAAFWDSMGSTEAHQLLCCEPESSEDEPRFSDVIPPPTSEPDVLDIKDLNADDIRNLLQQLSAYQQIDEPPPPPPSDWKSG